MMSRSCSPRCAVAAWRCATWQRSSTIGPAATRCGCVSLFYRAQREGALNPAGPGGRPSWDLRVLSSIEVSATAAEFLGRYLDQLRPTDREVLSSLSCIGTEFDLDDATAAAARSPDVVAHALWVCLELRLVEALDGGGQRITNAISRDARYRFSHDRVAEAARAGMSADQMRAVHLRIGRRLVTLGDDRVFEAARHVGIGGLGLADEVERTGFVEVVRRAARKARAQASFPLALGYCRNALDLLGGQRWAAHFALTRELQLDAAEAALLVGDIPVLNALLDEAEQMLYEPPDRARLAYLRLKGRVAENRLQEALEIGLQALDELGEKIPSEAGKPRMGNAIVRMRLTMSRWSSERLLDLPHCADRRVIEIQPILAELCRLSVLVRPNLLPLLVRKQLDLMLAHGHTPSSPVVIGGYGIVLVLLGDHAGSQRFGEVGMMLAERPEFRDARPQTLFMHLDFIQHWRHPLRDGLSELRDAIEEALDQGDQESAASLVAVLLSQSFCVGRPLAEIDAIASSLIPHIRSQPVHSSLCQAMHQFCLNLMGRSADPVLLAGESGYDEREVLPAARREGDEVSLSVAAAMKQGLHFWCGDHAGAVAHPGGNRAPRGLAGTAVSELVHLIAALSMIRCAPRDRSTARFVRQTLASHRKWATEAPENYAAPYALIRGAWARARGNTPRPSATCTGRSSSPRKIRLPMISARAQEEAAALYADTSRTTLRDHMLRSAYQRWLNLGFKVRTDWLAREHPWLLRRDLKTDAAGIDPVGAHQAAARAVGRPDPGRLGQHHSGLGGGHDRCAPRPVPHRCSGESVGPRHPRTRRHLDRGRPLDRSALRRRHRAPRDGHRLPHDRRRRARPTGWPVTGTRSTASGPVRARRSDHVAGQNNRRHLRRAGRIRRKLHRRPRTGGRLLKRPGRRAPVELPARGTPAGRRRTDSP